MTYQQKFNIASWSGFLVAVAFVFTAITRASCAEQAAHDDAAKAQNRIPPIPAVEFNAADRAMLQQIHSWVVEQKEAKRRLEVAMRLDQLPSLPRVGRPKAPKGKEK